MKKSIGKLLVLAMILVLIVTAAVACDPVDKGNENYGPAEGLADAKAYLEASYRGGATTGSVKLPTLATVGGMGSYPIAWTVDNAVVTITANDDNTVTLAVPKYHESDVTFVATGTLTANDGSTVSVSITYSYTGFAIATWEEYVAGCEAASKDAIFNVRGYIVGVNADYDSSSKVSLWLQDEDGHGYYAYKPTVPADLKAIIEDKEKSEPEKRAAINAAFPFGAEVVVSGALTNYGGALEFAAGCTIELTGNTAPEGTLTYTDVTEAFGNAPEDDKSSLVQYQATLATIKGVTIKNVNGYNMYFEINGQEYVCYSNIYLMNIEDSALLKNYWVKGLKADLTGVVNVYSGVYQIYPNSMDSIKLHVDSMTDAEKVAAIKDSVKLDKQYGADFTLPNVPVVEMSWAVKSGTGIELDGFNAKVTRADAVSTVVLTLTIKSGDVTETKDFTVMVSKIFVQPTTPEEIVKAAYELIDGETMEKGPYTLTGTVTKISGAWSTQYKNMTCTIVLEGLEDYPIDCYRLASSKNADASTIEIGDTITVTGDLTSDKGAKQFAQGVVVDEIVKGEKPTAEEKTIAEFIALEDGLGPFQLTGVVASIENTEFGNLYIADSTGVLYVYGVYGDGGAKFGTLGIAAGDTITIESLVSSYGGKQAKNATLIERVAATDETKAFAVQAALSISAQVTTELTLPASPIEGVTIAWASNNAAIAIDGTTATVTQGATDTAVVITATIVCGDTTLTKVFDVTVEKKVEGTISYEKATSLAVGDKIVIVVETSTYKYELTEVGASYGTGAEYTDTLAATYVLTVVAGSQDGSFAFMDSNGKYLTAKSGNNLILSDSVTDNSSFTFAYDAATETTTIASVGQSADGRILQWNSSSPRFACYKGTQVNAAAYKQVVANA